ncbi:unnamed protein product [Ambrosiozyma monospora]|uniref:Unnamed protein product n=1 Tax=Ambrosiozyma monospora TaxID=43982 RepID=A0ACB5TA87_AMBMO|nr:unnamed protein product [Ambrosiozyma monospora]
MVKLAALYGDLIKEYPIVSIEDPFAEDDWDAWSHFFKTVDIQIVGDDLTVTNPIRIKTAIEKKAANALLLKVNQIGTLTESINAAKDSYAAGWGVMVSHRSGETEDTTIADLVVGLRAGQIKTGAPARSERLAKLNQILRIEEELGDKAVYAVLKRTITDTIYKYQKSTHCNLSSWELILSLQKDYEAISKEECLLKGLSLERGPDFWKLRFRYLDILEKYNNGGGSGAESWKKLVNVDEFVLRHAFKSLQNSSGYTRWAKTMLKNVDLMKVKHISHSLIFLICSIEQLQVLL